MVRSRVIVTFLFRRQLHWAVVVSSILKFVFVWLFEIELALCSGWPQPHISPPALASWVLGLLWCIMNSSAFCSLEVLEAWTLGTQARVQVFWLWSDLQVCWQDEMALFFFFFLPPSPHPPWSSQVTLCENSGTIHVRLLGVNKSGPQASFKFKTKPSVVQGLCLLFVFLIQFP